MNNNYQQNMSNLLNQYLSNTAVLINKIYNYHWNIVGLSFFPMHKKLEEYYEEITDIFDEVAERIKQLEGFPITSLRKYSELAQIKEAESRNYDQREVITNLIRDFEYMSAITNQIIELTEQANDEVTNLLFGEYAKFFEKQLWMLKAHLK